VAVPYGSWPSPLRPKAAAAGALRFGALQLVDRGSAPTPEVLWTEGRPEEAGRVAIVRWEAGRRNDVGGPHTSARSGVNEYGGGALWADPAGGSLWWVDAVDQRIRRLAAGAGSGAALTPEPPAPRAWRYAAGVVSPDGAWSVCEREVHTDDDGTALAEPVNDIVAVSAAGGAPVVLTAVGDFAAGPALSPDGSALAWLRWDHPDMPWDAAALWCSEVDWEAPDGPTLVAPRRVAGGHHPGTVDRCDDSGVVRRAVSVCVPLWDPNGRLWWCDDREDRWQLRCAPAVGVPVEGAGDTAAARSAADEEVGEPRWVSGGSRYGFTGDGRMVHASTASGVDRVWVVDADGSRSPLPGPGFSIVEQLVVSGRHVALIGGTHERPTSVWLVDLGDADHEPSVTDLAPRPVWLEAADVSVPEHVTVPTADGEVTHALVYPPRLRGAEAPPGELPPLLLRVHGGPTAAARAECSPSVQFWTTRGFAVAEVNHRGSTGYGRRYRDLLRGRWGEVDVEDCLAVARHLGSTGRADPRRVVIRGGSSGGFTTLAALCADADDPARRALAAGCSLYGVTDLTALAGDMHKFESRYFDALVGPLPEAAHVYRSRSPLSHPERLRVPVLLLQGGQDPVVPLSQAEVLRDALAAAGVPHSLVVFPGEAHGFRSAATLVQALGLELAFYGAVLGFVPAGAESLPEVSLVLRP
jgi:dipeptidyl aminopeptidase/acylaminoacyl peptidase